MDFCFCRNVIFDDFGLDNDVILVDDTHYYDDDLELLRAQELRYIWRFRNWAMNTSENGMVAKRGKRVVEVEAIAFELVYA